LNTSLDSKNSDLFSVLKPYFKDNFNLARIKLVCLFIDALCKVKTVNYDRLASAFVNDADKNSSYRRIQRFMASFDFSIEIVAKLIFKLLVIDGKITLIIDRTNWKFGKSNINIFMLGIDYKGIAFPLMFKMLDKRGNSNCEERIELINKYIEWFGKENIDCILADREFIGEKWIGFLNFEEIKYHIRIRNNFKVILLSANKEVSVSWLFNRLKINQVSHYPKIVNLNGELVYLSATKTITREKGIELLILISYNKPQEALEYYKKRWQIETMFKSLKTSGFNIEDTHVTILDRLDKLLLLVMIAYTWSYLIGDHINRLFKEIKIKTHGRKAISIIKYGLDYLSRVLLSNVNKFNVDIYQFLSCT
jgi:Transposase DDE domain